MQDDILEIPAATQDKRFLDNALATSDPGIRFYAGAPLTLADGSKVGTLCVIDQEPRTLNDTQRAVPRHLAVAASHALEGRRALGAERSLRVDFMSALDALGASEARFRALSDASPLGVFATDRTGRCIYTNGRWEDIMGMPYSAGRGFGWIKALHPKDRDMVFARWRQATVAGNEFDMEFRIIRAPGDERTVHCRARPTADSLGGVDGYRHRSPSVQRCRSQARTPLPQEYLASGQRT